MQCSPMFVFLNYQFKHVVINRLFKELVGNQIYYVYYNCKLIKKNKERKFDATNHCFTPPPPLVVVFTDIYI